MTPGATSKGNGSSVEHLIHWKSDTLLDPWLILAWHWLPDPAPTSKDIQRVKSWYVPIGEVTVRFHTAMVLLNDQRRDVL